MKRQKIRFAILFISFLLLPVTLFYFSPVLPFLAARANIINGSIMVFLTLIIGGMLLGRAFCGWFMPCGAFQELCFPIRDKRIKQSHLNYLKIIIWLIWLGFLIYFIFKSGGYKTADFFFKTKHGFSVWNSTLFIVYYIIVLVFFISSLIFGKRSVCHYFCWITPFMMLGRKISNLFRIPSLRLKKTDKPCVDCKLCDKACPMSLEVSKMVQTGKMENPECILCGSCIDICKVKAIKFTFAPCRRNRA